MRVHSLATLPLLYLSGAHAHGDHSGGGTAAAGEGGPPPRGTIRGNPSDYAQRHMAQEHHIDTFDLPSFFHLHDLNRDGFWQKDEIEAVYGMHHLYAKKLSKASSELPLRTIVDTILRNMDKDGDGTVSLVEFEAAGLVGLPNFEELGAHGHHYDVESGELLPLSNETFEYHSTPETQTDESYVHPEDIEHFSHHEDIERIEAEREAKFAGISVEEALAQHDPEKQPPRKVRKPVEDIDPAVRFREAKAESEKLGTWGEGEGGFRPPSTPNEKMRKNLPYKYKFRKAWGDF
ncbi:hypothetical protein K488DRAFT_52491 [Vararia minispora EC-137]|uniref:Uncharacterized protein n=1 Tax=Vararia minispora EC-137 TaxID=1314806 RepID=A0ACB8QHH4_9AGAM|nr:hypothetical protein K488DRAFT_52491 [Vararia minispora EC-137]